MYKEKQKNSVIISIITYFVSFFLPAFILLVCFKLNAVFPFGENTIYATDLNGQYSAYLSYFQSVLKGENDFFYTFSKTLGGDFFGFGAYYLFSPFNLLLLLGTKETLPVVVEAIILLKISCCGLTMNCFLQNKKSCYMTAVFSVCYALMGYNMAYFYHLMWLDAVILFPLVMLGLQKLLKTDGKEGVFYSLVLSCTLIYNYYIGYMVCVAILFYTLWYIWAEKKNIYTFLRFLLWSILSGGLAAIVLVPTVFSLIGGKAGMMQEFSWNRNWNIIDLLKALFPLPIRSINGDLWNEKVPLLYCSTFVILCMILYFIHIENKLEQKFKTAILLFSLIIMSLFESSDILWHAGNRPVGFPYRYSFIITFFLINTGYEGICLLKYKKRIIRYAMIVLSGFVFFELFVNSNLSIAAVKNSYQNLRVYQEKIIATNQLLEQLPNDDFYRVEKTDDVRLNNTMLYGYDGLSHFSSTEKLKLTEFMGKLGYTTYFENVNWSGYTGNSTIVSDSFFALRYIIGNEKPDQCWISYGDHIYENPYALSLGNVFDVDLADINMETHPFEIQNEIFGSEVLQRLQVYEQKTDENNRYVFSVNCISDDLAPVYLYLPTENRQGVMVYVEDQEGITYKTHFENGVLSLGNFSNAEISLAVETLGGQPLDVEPLVYQLNWGNFKQSIELIREHPVNVVKISSSELHGTVQIEEEDDKLFVLSIPYDKGWKCWVDGSSVEIECVLENLMGLRLTNGKHELVLRYRPQGWYLGISISALALLELGIYLGYIRIVRKKNEKVIE